LDLHYKGEIHRKGGWQEILAKGGNGDNKGFLQKFGLGALRGKPYMEKLKKSWNAPTGIKEKCGKWKSGRRWVTDPARGSMCQNEKKEKAGGALWLAEGGSG